jgi:hypothetical protein
MTNAIARIPVVRATIHHNRSPRCRVVGAVVGEVSVMGVIGWRRCGRIDGDRTTITE